MKALVILLLFTVSLCAEKKVTKKEDVKIKTNGPRIIHDGRPLKTTFIPVTKKYCDECAKKGFCPVQCARFYKKEKEGKKEVKPTTEVKSTKVKQSTFCERCQKEGNCPPICKRFFDKKHERNCELCLRKNYCPIDCKDYYIKF